jgi:hypothetical protein
MKPGVVVAYDGPLQDITGRRVDTPPPKPAPKSFRKTHKVTTPVFMEETGTFAEQEVDADTALKALADDISALEAFRRCIAGG